MSRLVDVVNFNADASCLSSASWLRSLRGGRHSPFFVWLQGYVQHEKKVTLGIVGGAVADIATFNPEAIELVNRHPEVFELVLRPFAHDVALLRTSAGFLENVCLGRRVIEREFANVVPYFLPPEFMLTNMQVKHLQEAGFEGVFINASRFKEELRRQLPSRPYRVRGVLESELPCIPMEGELTQAYLHALHSWDARRWNDRLLGLSSSDIGFSWRDGESPILIPDGVAREENWLREEARGVERASLREVLANLSFAQSDDLPPEAWLSYPVHSFAAWLKEFRMLGYVERTRELEESLAQLTPAMRVLWLQAIGSDVLSAVEKNSPHVVLVRSKGAAGESFGYEIRRSDRGFEGEECLAAIELMQRSPTQARELLTRAERPHLIKLRTRLEYVESLGEE